jgi:hypothetical protein
VNDDDGFWWPLPPHLRRGPELELGVRDWMASEVSVSRSSSRRRMTPPAPNIVSLAFYRELLATGARAIVPTHWVAGPVMVFLQAVTTPLAWEHSVAASPGPRPVLKFWPWLRRLVPARALQVAKMRERMDRVERRLAELEKRVA